MAEIKTWAERCETHPDHQTGMVTDGMIHARMQEEIDDLRAALAQQAEPPMTAYEAGQHVRKVFSAAPTPQAGEPIAWGMLRSGGVIVDCKTPDEHARYEGAFTIPLYTAEQVRAAVLAERERCAKVCRELYFTKGFSATALDCEDAIRKEPT